MAHLAALPHGSLSQPFTDIFFVTGTSTPTFMGMTWRYSRNMTVLRDGADLTLVNSVRLDDAGLDALDALGRVRHVVKLGAFHGIDDAFYLDRYGALSWALPGATHESGRATDRELRPGGDVPHPRLSTFAFESSKLPEGLLLCDQDGGVLVSCDSLQNWTRADAYFDEVSAQKMGEIGFLRPANIGPGWRMACEPNAADFARVLELRFRHLVPAHGEIIRDSAREQLAATFARELGI